MYVLAIVIYGGARIIVTARALTSAWSTRKSRSS